MNKNPDVERNIKLVEISRDALVKTTIEAIQIYESHSPEEEVDAFENIRTISIGYDRTVRCFEIRIVSVGDDEDSPRSHRMSRLALIGAVEKAESIDIDGPIPEEFEVVGSGFDQEDQVGFIEIESEEFDSVMEAGEAPKIEVEVAEEGDINE